MVEIVAFLGLFQVLFGTKYFFFNKILENGENRSKRVDERLERITMHKFWEEGMGSVLCRKGLMDNEECTINDVGSLHDWDGCL